jgi:O-acetyl-ADP-ribose deacetylase (regulator of RNase III)
MNERSELTIGRLGRGPAKLTLVVGDITRERVDAIVNAANAQLSGGGGVDGAIHRAAGPDLLSELKRRYTDCPTGSAVITGSGRLAEHGVLWVIHAVGPIWRGGDRDEPAQLRSAYLAALRLADEAGAQTVALPAISCGVYGYPLAEGAAVAVSAVAEGLASARNVTEARFVLFSVETLGAFRQALGALAAG